MRNKTQHPIRNMMPDNQKAFNLINKEQKLSLLRKNKVRDELLTSKNIANSLNMNKTELTSPREKSNTIDSNNNMQMMDLEKN